MDDDEVKIRSAPAKGAPAAPKATPKKGSTPPPVVDAFAFWDGYYKTHDESPKQLFTTVDLLIREKGYGQAEAAIKGYLHHHDKQAEPWMYELLVKTIEERKGTPQEVSMSLGYAAYLAKRTKNPNDLVRVADMMVLRNLYGTVGDPDSPKYQTNIGELVDLAAEKVPAHHAPPMMSVNLATKLKDPKRMGNAAEQLLALGWPGYDDTVRRDVKQQVGNLAKVLKDEGKEQESSDLLARLATSEVRDVYIRLTWAGESDIDLQVDEPYGATAKFQSPRTVFGGALVKNGYGKHPEEVYVCPRAFPGKYTIRVESIYIDEAKPITEATLEVIIHEGSAEEIRQTHKINLAKPEPIVLDLAEGRRTTALPYLAGPEVRSSTEKPKADADLVKPSKPFVKGQGPLR